MLPAAPSLLSLQHFGLQHLGQPLGQPPPPRVAGSVLPLGLTCPLGLMGCSLPASSNAAHCPLILSPKICHTPYVDPVLVQPPSSCQ